MRSTVATSRSPVAAFLPLPMVGRALPLPSFVAGDVFLRGTGVRTGHCFVDTMLSELPDSRRRPFARMSSPTANETLEEKTDKKMLQKGQLLVFRKDSQKALLAVVQKRDGKKNWMVYDQNGVLSSIRPQQVLYIVPGIEDFDPADLPDFVKKAHALLDPTVLEFAWEELVENKKSVSVEELAEIIYGCKDSLESYCTHILLSRDDIYFSAAESKSGSLYQARLRSQVEALLQKKYAKEALEKDFDEFIQLLKSAKNRPHHDKPPKSTWLKDEKARQWIKSLELYAIDACKDNDERKTAGNILKSMGLAKTSSAAVDLLISVGFFSLHVNLDLLKYNVRTEYSEEVLSAAEVLLESPSDHDLHDRKDLQFLKVYAIDVDEADELDDALSASRLPDGRLKIWIHVADPTCLIEPQSIIDKEAMRRGTSIFLPTVTFPMFPERLAMDAMSLQQGKLCKAVSVSAILHHDGSIAEYKIENSLIRPTYMLTYESATELLNLNLEEEAELGILAEAASLRLQWRRSQGAIDMSSIEPRIKVADPDTPDPSITLYVEDQASPAMRLVSEMMILCGEIVATFGSCNNIPLPYRGQPQHNISSTAFAHLPEGPVRSYAYVRNLRAAELDCRKAIRHGILGLPGYVQFTSPIRRYVDLLAHYQVKAFLRGQSPPFSAGELEGIAFLANMHTRVAKKLQNTSLRYWLLEYLRRQPRERKYKALVLKFIKDRLAALLLVEVGLQAAANVSIPKQIGDEIEVAVQVAHPRNDVIDIIEVQVDQQGTVES